MLCTCDIASIVRVSGALLTGRTIDDVICDPRAAAARKPRRTRKSVLFVEDEAVPEVVPAKEEDEPPAPEPVVTKGDDDSEGNSGEDILGPPQAIVARFGVCVGCARVRESMCVCVLRVCISASVCVPVCVRVSVYASACVEGPCRGFLLQVPCHARVLSLVVTGFVCACDCL